MRCQREEQASALRFELELGSRARTTDPARWQRFVQEGPNPSEASEVWASRVEDDRGRGVRPPIEYASVGEDAGAWRATVDQLAADADYQAAVFLRFESLRPADDLSLPVLEPPYRVAAERPYLVRVASYNPHLEAERLRDVRLVPLYDELATAMASRPEEELPADGAIDLLVEPIVPGPGWLELHASLGVELVPAASLGWIAEGLPAGTPSTPTGADIAAALVSAMAPPDPLAEAAVRAYALVRESGGLDAADRLRLLEHLRAIAPEEPRLAEQQGIARYESGRPDEALRVLAGIPLDDLATEGRATLVAAELREGRLPDPIERLRIADLSRPEAFRLILEASAHVSPDEQVRLSEFVVRRLVSEDRAAAWLTEVLARPLPSGARDRLRALREGLEAGREEEG